MLSVLGVLNNKLLKYYFVIESEHDHPTVLILIHATFSFGVLRKNKFMLKK